MPTVTFYPEKITFAADVGTKILVVAKKSKVDIRFGCAACKCGTCAVKISDKTSCLPMQEDEKALLNKIKLQTDGLVRLSCRAKIQADLVVDLDFQNSYDAADYF